MQSERHGIRLKAAEDIKGVQRPSMDINEISTEINAVFVSTLSPPTPSRGLAQRAWTERENDGTETVPADGSLMRSTQQGFPDN